MCPAMVEERNIFPQHFAFKGGLILKPRVVLGCPPTWNYPGKASSLPANISWGTFYGNADGLSYLIWSGKISLVN